MCAWPIRFDPADLRMTSYFKLIKGKDHYQREGVEIHFEHFIGFFIGYLGYVFLFSLKCSDCIKSLWNISTSVITIKNKVNEF